MRARSMCPYHLRQLTWMRLRLRTVFCSARSDSIGCRVIANLKADRCDLHVGHGCQAQSARGYGEKDEQNRLKCWALKSYSCLLLINMLCDLCYVLTSSLVILDLLVRASTDLQSVFIIELAAWRQDLFITDTTAAFARVVMSGGSKSPRISCRTVLRALRTFGLQIPLCCNDAYDILNYNLVLGIRRRHKTKLWWLFWSCD